MAASNTVLSLPGLRQQRGKSPMMLVLLLVVGVFGQVCVAQFGGGTGTVDDPYLIYTAEQLNAIGGDSPNLNKHFKLMTDIDLSDYSGTDFNIIGTSFGNAFTGVFDGNGRRIYNFTYTSRDTDYIGLFGSVRGEDARIKNLGLIDCNIDAGTGQQVGALVGRLNRGAAVTGCYARGGSVSGGKDVGGLVGDVSDATISYSCSTASASGRSDVGSLVGSYSVHIMPSSDPARQSSTTPAYPIVNCFAAGSVSARINAGGLVGDNWGGTITNCYAAGNVSAGNEGGWRLGGLAGFNFEGAITDCYSTGNVSGQTEVGGLVGGNRDGTIANCYSTGAIAGKLRVGGLMGFNSRGTVTACFWDCRSSGLSNMCGEEQSGTGCDDGNGMTSAQMQIKSTFMDVGWDFVSESANGTDDIWTICEGLSYPQLTWQFIPGDFDGDYRVDLADFAFFAERWLSSDVGFFWCRGADLTGDGEVGFDDFGEFVGNWLTEGISNPSAAIYLTIDDFESYNDLDPGNPDSNRIFDVWSDGYDNPSTNGAVVGHTFPPYAEREIVYSGEQSMPYYYNAIYKVARAELALSPPQNWAETGAEALSLWFCGNRINGVTPMGVVINGDSAVYHDNPEATRIQDWTEWIIELKAFTDVDLTNVNSIAICFGDPSNLHAGGDGTMFFDNIRLYGPG